MAHALEYHLNTCDRGDDIEGVCISEVGDPEYLALCLSLTTCCSDAVF